ncbi:hypothetical protein [Allokutzneria sp. NRRL B-24872]|uniref:hypothetical protein n=1 Tax=Allokutzneria sp. NRRL B-24872 TaxID=1137961 RepID=UPI000A3AC8E3|nr:hypothetical protein [Allokutzneria sp. NRRL B-24872]
MDSTAPAFGRPEALNAHVEVLKYVEATMRYHAESFEDLRATIHEADNAVLALAELDETERQHTLTAYQDAQSHLEAFAASTTEIREWFKENGSAFPDEITHYEAMTEQLATWRTHLTRQAALCDS